MKRRLILVFLAVSATVTLAFLVPLGLLVRRTIEDRALNAARADAASLAPLLSSTPDDDTMASAIDATDAGRASRVTVFFDDGHQVGFETTLSAAATGALTERRSIVAPASGGQEVLTAVALADGETAIVRVFVENEALRRGQWKTLGILGGVGMTLIGVSVLVATVLANSIVRPSEQLAAAATRIGLGDMAVKVDEEGPAELRAIAKAFNDMTGQIVELLQHERELVADLSHQLRTPLTKLRVDIDRVAEDGLAEELRDDVAALTVTVDDVIRKARNAVEHRGPVSCDAVSVLSERVEFWSTLARDEGRRWRFHQRMTEAVVSISVADLAAAIDVLIDNIFAHTAEGVPFSIAVEEAATDVLIVVEDEGKGINPAQGKRGVSSAGSTGIGLDIVRRVAEEAGGTLEIGASEPSGARFELRLPRLPKPQG